MAGKEFAMTIPSDQEEVYRRAGVEINQMVAAYKASFVAEPEDYLAMAAIQAAVLKVKLEMERSVDSRMEALEEIDNKLNDYLDNLRTDSF